MRVRVCQGCVRVCTTRIYALPTHLHPKQAVQACPVHTSGCRPTGMKELSMDTVTHAVEALVGRALAAPSRAASSIAKYFGAAATGCPMYSIKLQDPYLHGHTNRNWGTQRQQWDSLWRQSGATVTALWTPQPFPFPNRPPPSPLCTHATTTGLAHGYGIQPTFSPPKK